jgi:hypothetical protein
MGIAVALMGIVVAPIGRTLDSSSAGGGSNTAYIQWTVPVLR